MLHTVLITAHPDNITVYDNAISACQSRLELGDKINQIFFMHDATFMAVHEDAEIWSKLAERNGFELHTCVSTAEDLKIEFKDYALGFLQGGLSALADSILQSSNILQFGCDESLVHRDDMAFLSSEKLSTFNEKKALEYGVVFIFQADPFENSLVREGIDLLLVLSAFEAQLKVVFKEAGLQNLIVNENAPRFVKRFKALTDFGIDECYVVNSDDQDVSIPVKIISDKEIQSLAENSHVLYF